MSLPQSSLNDAKNYSETIRASVLDVCLQLGALDDNSLIAEWMFNDSSIEGDRSLRLQTPTTRFKEMISSECLVRPDGEIPNERHRRRLFSFSIKAPAFTKHLSRPKSRSTIDKGSLLKQRPSRAAGPHRASFSRGSFFKRAIHFSETDEVNGRISNTVVDDDGGVSTKRRTFFQRKSSIRVPSQANSFLGSQAHSEIPSARSVTSSIDAPIHSRFTKLQALDHPRTIQEDDTESDWEEIEAIPDSPLYPLPNKGMKPSAVLPVQPRSQRQSTRTIDSDLDTGVVVHDAVHYKFTLAFPRVLFRRPYKRGHQSSLSSQRRKGSSSLKPTASSSPKQTSAGSSSTPRKQLRINATKTNHFRSRSGSLPPSPFVLLTSRNNDVDPTTQIVFSSETPPRPASESAVQAQTSCMGYHHQFFVQAQEEAFKTSLNSPVSPFTPVWQNT